jgi:hypothetical protein
MSTVAETIIWKSEALEIISDQIESISFDLPLNKNSIKFVGRAEPLIVDVLQLARGRDNEFHLLILASHWALSESAITHPAHDVIEKGIARVALPSEELLLKVDEE